MGKLTLAEEKCRQRGRRFSTLFRNQFLLTDMPTALPSGWAQQSFGRWKLMYGTALPVTHIVDEQDQLIGFLLGYALDENSRPIRQRFNLETSHPSSEFWAIVEERISTLSGRYVAAILTSRGQRLFPDPVSDIPILYDKNTRRIGSSLGLVLRRSLVENPNFGLRSILTGAQTLGFGHSSDRYVKKLIPNHFLDLKTFAQDRFWPKPEHRFVAEADEAPAIIAEIATRLRSHTTAWVSEFDCVLPVTGGRDSRILLASAETVLPQIKQFCGHRFHNASKRDAKNGKQIVASLGFDYVNHYRVNVSLGMMRDMRLKMGWSGAREELQASASIENYPEDHLILRGNILELLRANQYRADKLERPMSLLHAIRRTRVSPVSDRTHIMQWQDIYEGWFATLPANAARVPYDFGFIEMLLPNSQGPYFTAFHRTPFLNPFNDRRLIELAIRIPAKIRFSGDAVLEIINTLKPELLKFPFS